MPSSAPILAVERLTVRRGANTVLQDVSFSLAEGMNMAIVGPNGAGKSTLVQAILGLLPCHQGEITLLGQRLHSSGSRDSFGNSDSLGSRDSSGNSSAAGRRSRPRAASLFRQGVAYLPQNFLVDARIPMTVGEFVGLGWDGFRLQLPWQGWRDRRRAVHQALAQVEASHLQSQSLSSLSSGGQLKRILLAYCLVRPRRLLILDEAPAGLDIAGEADFYRLLSKLKQEQGWSILQISHDLDRVRETCDCVLCINRRLLKLGAPAEVLHPEVLSEAYGPRPFRDGFESVSI